MSLPCSLLASAIAPPAAILMGIPQTLQVAPFGSNHTCVLIPLAAVLVGVPQAVDESPLCSL